MGVENLLTSSCEAAGDGSEGKLFEWKNSVDKQVMSHSTEAGA